MNAKILTEEHKAVMSYIKLHSRAVIPKIKTSNATIEPFFTDKYSVSHRNTLTWEELLELAYAILKANDFLQESNC